MDIEFEVLENACIHNTMGTCDELLELENVAAMDDEDYVILDENTECSEDACPLKSQETKEAHDSSQQVQGGMSPEFGKKE